MALAADGVVGRCSLRDCSTLFVTSRATDRRRTTGSNCASIDKRERLPAQSISYFLSTSDLHADLLEARLCFIVIFHSGMPTRIILACAMKPMARSLVTRGSNTTGNRSRNAPPEYVVTYSFPDKTLAADFRG